MPGISACSLQILYLREDKNPIYEDTRIEQISNIVPFIEDDFIAKKIEKLPPSEIVYKSVYRKIQKSKIYYSCFRSLFKISTDSSYSKSSISSLTRHNFSIMAGSMSVV